MNGPMGKKKVELLQDMGRVLGYGKELSHLDVQRVYYPEALGMQVDRAEEFARELLRVLKASGGFAVTQTTTAGFNEESKPTEH